MLRIRLAGAALIALSILPGCKCFGDRWNLTSRPRDPYPAGMPVSYPGGDPNCGCQGGPVIGAPGSTGPIILGPGGTLPNPGTIPNIPPAGIKESPGTGKQFETDGKEASRGTAMPPGITVSGPILGSPPTPFIVPTPPIPKSKP